jgi:hypothetical protein
MDFILHTIGACSDNHAHLDLIDVILYGTLPFTTVLFYIKNRVVNFLNKNFHGKNRK